MESLFVIPTIFRVPINFNAEIMLIKLLLPAAAAAPTLILTQFVDRPSWLRTSRTTTDNNNNILPAHEHNADLKVPWQRSLSPYSLRRTYSAERFLQATSPSLRNTELPQKNAQESDIKESRNVRNTN